MNKGFYNDYKNIIDKFINKDISEKEAINKIQSKGSNHFNQEISIMLEEICIEFKNNGCIE